MRRLLLTMLSVGALAGTSQAQLVNDGGTIIVESGAILMVETDIDNKVGGTITNNGTIEVKGDLLNNGSLDCSSASLVRFFGDADSELTSNGDTIYNMEVDKTSGNVVLMDDAAVQYQLTFDAGGKVVLGDHDLTIGLGDGTNDGVIIGAGADKYVQADGAGYLKKHVETPSPFNNFTFEVGDADEYSRLESSMIGGAYTPMSTVAVSVVDDTLDNAPLATTDFISRYWNVELNDITGTTENTVTGYYTPADVSGMATDVNGASFAAGDWDFTNSGGNGTDNVTSRIDGQSSADFTGINKFGRVEVKAFLQGALSGTTMTNSINSLLPTTSPYSDGVSVDAIPATDIVDWVAIEVRDAMDNTNVISTNSAFLKQNGDIVDISGSGNPFLKDAPTNAYIAVRHRNHLGVMTAADVPVNEGNTVNFTDAATSTFGTNAQAVVGTNRAMWAGDANGDNKVVYVGSGTDVNAVSAEVFANPANPANIPLIPYAGYRQADLNLSGATVYVGGGTEVNVISSTVFANPSNPANIPLIPLLGTVPN